MAGDYKKLLNKKKKQYCNTKTMGVNIDKNEYYEIRNSKITISDGGTIYGKGGYIDKDGESKDLPKYFKIDLDGKLEEIEQFDIQSGDVLFINNGNNIEIINKGKTYTYKEYKNGIIVSSQNGKIILKIAGEDGCSYFTVINGKGKQLLEPIKLDDELYPLTYGVGFCGSDKIIYQKDKGCYEMIDISGDVIIPHTKGYKYIGYQNGVWFASKTENWGVDKSAVLDIIDKDGKTVNIKLLPSAYFVSAD